MRLLQMEAAHAFHAGKERNQLELDWNPAAPFSFFKRKFALLDRDSRHWFYGIDRDGELLGRSGRSSPESVVRPD